MSETTFGDIIYRKRKSLNMTQEILAEKVGVRPTYIGYLERGKRKASPKIAAAIAEHLGLNRSHLFLASNPIIKDFLPINEETFEIENKPLPQSLIDLIDDENIRTIYNISNEDIDKLIKLSFLGTAKSKLDYILLIQIIRQIFETV